MLIVSIALVGSAFTNQKAIGDYYVQYPDGSYRLITGLINTGYCETSDRVCILVQITDENLPSILTYPQVRDLVWPPSGPSKLAPITDPIDGQPILGFYIE